MTTTEAAARAVLRDAARQTLIDLSAPGADPAALAKRLRMIGGMVAKDLEEAAAADDGTSEELHAVVMREYGARRA